MISRLVIVYLTIFCAVTTIAGHNLSQDEKLDQQLLVLQHENLRTQEETGHRITKREQNQLTIDCSLSWNSSSQSFQAFISWTIMTQDPDNIDNYRIIRTQYCYANSAEQCASGNNIGGTFLQKNIGETSFNEVIIPKDHPAFILYTVNPVYIEDSPATSDECCVSISPPPPSTISTIGVISSRITLTQDDALGQTLAEIEVLYLNWTIPQTPNANLADLVYQVRISADEATFDDNNVYFVDNVTSIDQYFQSGSADVPNNISVPENFTHLRIQMRSYYQVTINQEVINITSNWSSTQKILREIACIPMTSSTSTCVPILFDSTSVHSSATPKDNQSSQVAVIASVIAVVISVIVVIAVVVLVGLCIFLYRKKKRSAVHGEVLNLKNLARMNTQMFSDKWEVPYECIHRISYLGEGGFGKVYEAVIKGFTSPVLDMYIKKREHNHSVAVKTLKEDATDIDKDQFLKEIELMKKISECSNPHIINMIGAVTTMEPMLLVIEFMKYGDLQSYLKACRKENELYGENQILSELGTLEESDVSSFAYQISSGMEYLASMKLVHRDLASRNILVGEGKKLKITDFGLTRMLSVESVYIATTKGQRLPVRWMAIESIVDRTFTTESDVWSFGVTLWEIGSLGEIPYSVIGNDDLLDYIKSGNRLGRPDQYISEEVYSIMSQCWKVRPSDRPSFTELRKKFDSMLCCQKDVVDYYIQLRPEIKGDTLKPKPNLYVKSYSD